MNPLSENFILKDVNNSFLSLFDYINPFSDNFILKSTIEGIGNILSYINPFNDNFFGYKITELFNNLLKNLFVPNDDYFKNKITSIQEKFSFVDNIKNSVNSIKEFLINMNAAPSLSVTIGATKYSESQQIKIIDLEWYSQFKDYGDLFISAFMYIFFIWRVYISLPGILSGASSSSLDIISIIKK